jgi:hypothetical protein
MLGVLNQRTLNVPVRGLTLRVQTERETLGEMQETLSMRFFGTEIIIGTKKGGSLPLV